MTKSTNAININPLEDNVIISVEKPQDRTKVGILLPENSRESTRRGLVKKVGPGKTVDGKIIPMNIKVGDRVLLSRYADNSVNTVNIDDNNYLIISQSEILATLV